VGHDDWKLRRGAQFCKTARESFAQDNKVPGVATYNLGTVTHSGKKTIIGSKWNKTKKRTFLDAVREASDKTPAMGKYDPKLSDIAHVPTPHFDRSAMSKSPETKAAVSTRKVESPGPTHYDPKWALTIDRSPNFKYTKSGATNFLDMDNKTNAAIPGPGHYNNVRLEKISRGTKWCQVHGYMHNALNGVF